MEHLLGCHGEWQILAALVGGAWSGLAVYVSGAGTWLYGKVSSLRSSEQEPPDLA